MKIKIGRYYYEGVPFDERGEPKFLKGDEEKDIYTLIDYDGEPIMALRRVLKNKKYKKEDN